MTFGGIGDHLADLLLRIEAAVRFAIILLPSFGNERFLAPAANFSQLGIFLDFDAPALVLGEMPMEGVEFVKAQQVDELS